MIYGGGGGGQDSSSILNKTFVSIEMKKLMPPHRLINVKKYI